MPSICLDYDNNPRLNNSQSYLRGLDRSWFNDHLDFVLGPGQQLDGARLPEPGSVRLEVHRAVVGKHLQGNPNFDDLGDVGHVSIKLVQAPMPRVSGTARCAAVQVSGVDQFRQQTRRVHAEKPEAERTAQGIAQRCAPAVIPSILQA